MEEVEQDLERAWRAGYVDLDLVLGGAPEAPVPAPHHKLIALDK